MANVKITELTELAAIDVADNDVVPIVDVGGDTTKKITIESLKSATAAANDFVTFIRLNANINVVQDNVASLSTEDTALQSRLTTNVTAFTNEDTALQARIDANALVAASNDFITFTQLNANINVVQDNVASIDANVASIVDTGGHTVTFSANVIPSADGVYDLGSATNKWKDLYLTGSSIKLGGITISSLGDEGITITGTSGEQANVVTPQLGGAANVSANIATLEANVAATDTRLGANITLLTNEDTALQARIGANALVAAANDFITFTQLNANINVVQDNVASLTSTSATEDTALQSRLTTNVTAFTNEDTALQARLATNVTAFTNEDTALQARIDANALVAASNDFITFTRLNSNVNVVQDNVAQNVTDITALEARRVANIAGAVSSITTSDLTASRALVSDGSGKVDVSAVTATELGYLDGVSGAIQTQLDAKAALAGATFTGQVNMSDDLVVTGNLIVNGDTTTANSVNLVVEDRIIMLANSVTGAPSADVGLLFNRGNQGNAALFYDESATTFKLSDTQDPASNTALSPVSASNLDVGILTAVTVTQNGATLDELISSNVDGAISSVNDTNLTASRALASDVSGKIVVSDVTSTELGYLDGVTSAIQTQLNAKQATITGAATTIDDTDLTASRALASDGSGKVAVSAVTSTELGYLDGVTSAIQTQLDSKSSTSNAAALAAGIASVGVADGSITTAKLAADAVTGAKIADDAIDSEHYTDGSIDRVHLAADIIDGTKIADDVLNSEHYVAGSIDAEHIASSAVTTAKINDNAVTVGKLAATLDLGVLS